MDTLQQHALRRYRIENKLGIAEVAARAGVAKSTISRLERGEMSPSLSLVSRLITVTNGGVRAEDFFPAQGGGGQGS